MLVTWTTKLPIKEQSNQYAYNTGWNSSGDWNRCLQYVTITALLLIILHEYLLYPVFHRVWCYPRILSFYKGIIGMLLQIARVSLLLVYEVLPRHNYIQYNGHNATIDCLFHTTHGSFDFRLIVIPDFLQSISLMMIYLGTFEFLSAQVPCFMKGLVVGVILCSTLLSGAVWFVLSIPFNRKLSIWGTGTISCGFWYTLLLAIIQICFHSFVILIILTRWYKKRKRQDVLPNEQIFAERYYSYWDAQIIIIIICISIKLQY